MTFEEICSRFGVDGHGKNTVKCKCSAHNDKQSSLSISRGSNGRTLVFCQAGCETEDVLSKRGLKLSDLSDGQADPEAWKKYVSSWGKRKFGKETEVEAIYSYLDLSGKYAYSKIRYTGKNMAYGILSGDRFTFSLGGKNRKDWLALYCRSVTAIRKAAEAGDPVYLVEGEKDVRTLDKRKLIAATAGSATDWKTGLSEVFRGVNVVILSDNDAPGLKLARTEKRDLTGIAASIKILLPVPEVRKADITDFFEQGKTEDDFKQLVSGNGLNDDEISRLIRKYESESDSGQDGNGEANKLANKQANRNQDLERFHLTGKNGQITGVFDWEIFSYLREREHILILGGIPYIYRNGLFEADQNGARLKTMIRELIYPEFIKANTIKRVYDLFMTAAELQAKFEDFNSFPVSWICFQNGMYDPVGKRMIPHDPKYRALNQIPHDYDPEGDPAGDVVEGWLRVTVPDPDDREMLLQYIGLCMNRDTKQQKFLMLHGLGGTGKSGMIGLVSEIVGEQNSSHVPLEKLSERFTAFEMLGKLLNSCADLKITALEDVTILKQATGEDPMRGEAKGKDGVNFKSYAKLLFSVNELPTVKSERTNGFYRRLLILTVNKIPQRVDVNIFDRLKQQLPYLIKLSVTALERMYSAGTITESENSRAAVKQMMTDSDTVEAWISETMFRVSGSRVERGTLFSLYLKYCEGQERQALQRVNFFKALRSKGFSEVKENGIRKFIGLSETDPAAENPGQMVFKTAPANCPRESVTGKNSWLSGIGFD